MSYLCARHFQEQVDSGDYAEGSQFTVVMEGDCSACERAFDRWNERVARGDGPPTLMETYRKAQQEKYHA